MHARVYSNYAFIHKYTATGPYIKVCKFLCSCMYSSAKHPIVNEESAPGKHSAEATQVNQTTAVVVTTTPSFRGSRNTSKSSNERPIQVSSDPSTPMESPRLKPKTVIVHKPLSKASNRSNRSEKIKMATTGKITYVNIS